MDFLVLVERQSIEERISLLEPSWPIATTIIEFRVYDLYKTSSGPTWYVIQSLARFGQESLNH